MDRNLIILAGGKSSRMKVAHGHPAVGDQHHADAVSRPKGMIRVGPEGRPFIDYLLYHAHEAGYRDVVIVTGEDGSVFRERYGSRERDNHYHGLEISYAVQPIPEGRAKPLGTADAVMRALRSRPDWAGKQFTVCNSDNLYSINALFLLLRSTTPGALIDYDREALGMSRDRVEQFAVLMKDEKGFISDIVEKPDASTVKRAAVGGRIGVSMNIFRLSVDIILPIAESLPLHPVRHERELPVAVAAMAKQYPGSVKAIPVAESVPDLTGRGDIAEVEHYLRSAFGALPWGGVS